MKVFTEHPDVLNLAIRDARLGTLLQFARDCYPVGSLLDTSFATDPMVRIWPKHLNRDSAVILAATIPTDPIQVDGVDRENVRVQLTTEALTQLGGGESMLEVALRINGVRRFYPSAGPPLRINVIDG